MEHSDKSNQYIHHKKRSSNDNNRKDEIPSRESDPTIYSAIDAGQHQNTFNSIHESNPKSRKTVEIIAPGDKYISGNSKNNSGYGIGESASIVENEASSSSIHMQRQRSLVRPERSRSRKRGLIPLSKRFETGGYDDDENASQYSGNRSRCYCQWWGCLSRTLTCCICDSCLSKSGMHDPLMKQAWREKFALCMIIIVSCLLLGFITFGMSTLVCRPPTAVFKHKDIAKKNTYTERWFVIHGFIYNVPAAYDPYPHTGVSGGDPLSAMAGQDLTVYFPYNPSCQKAGFNYQFECKRSNYPYEYCHSTDDMKGLDKVGPVNWDWDELDNSTSRLAYNGFVLDVGYYLEQIHPTAPRKPFGNDIDKILRNSLGGDATKALSAYDDQTIKCLIECFGAGTLDVKSVGCIFTDIVLYISLVAILAVVIIKFILAVVFAVYFSKKLCNYEQRSKNESSNSNIDETLESSEIGDGAISEVAMTGMNESKSSLGHRKHSSSTSIMALRMGPISPTHPNHGSLNRGRQVSRHQPLIPTTSNVSIATPPIKSSNKMTSRYATALQRGPPRSSLSLSTQFEENTNIKDHQRRYSIPIANTRIDNIKQSATPMYTILVVTCYSEGREGLKSTIESLCETDYPDDQKMLFIVADGLITGSGNDKSTPEILIDMMEIDEKAGLVDGQPWSKIINPHGFAGSSTNRYRSSVDQAEQENTTQKGKFMSTSYDDNPSSNHGVWLPEAYSYVAIADGEKRHNMARVFAGHYRSKSHRVPAIVVVKCGAPAEAILPKPGNRGKRDSQIILMSFLSKVLFDDRMTLLEYDMYVKMKYLMEFPPDIFETILCVDADTVVMPDCLVHMTSVMKMDPFIMGLCGETKIANKSTSFWTAMQVFEYFISHHLNKAFESIFGGVTCLPGCFCMYRIKAPKGDYGCYVPVLASPDIVDSYSENITDTLHKKNLLLLGEDRYLTTLMLKTFPKRKLVFVPAASCKTFVPETFAVLKSQRRRWINSTIHNLFELVLVSDLCGIFCCSMQFIIFMELVGTLVLPAAIIFTGVLIISSFVSEPQYIPLALLAAILGLPALLIFFTARSFKYFLYMIVYFISLPIWNLILPAYAYWHFDDFSWGETRKVANYDKKESHGDAEGVFDHSQIFMKRWHEFEADCNRKAALLRNISNTENDSVRSEHKDDNESNI